MPNGIPLGIMAKQIAQSAAIHGGVGATVGGGLGALTSPDDRWGGARKGALVGGGIGLGTGLALGVIPHVDVHNAHKILMDATDQYTQAAAQGNAENTRDAFFRLEGARQFYDCARDFAINNSPTDNLIAAGILSAPTAFMGGSLIGLHHAKKVRGEIARLKANQPDASAQESVDTPVKQAYLMATGDNTFDQEKMAGWLTDTISKAKSYIAPSAVGKVVSPASGALKATGTMKQLQAGRNFGGATVDPFVKMRKSMMSPVVAAA